MKTLIEKSRISTVFAIFFASFSFTTFAQTYTGALIQKNTIFEAPNGGLSNGAGAYMFSGRSGQAVGFSKKRGLLQFDLTGLPAGATITSVSFSINVDFASSGPQNYTLHRFTSDWGEGTSNSGPSGSGAPSTLNDATWTCGFDNGAGGCLTSWATPGGDFVAGASATQLVAGTGTINTWSGPGLVADVQYWNDNAGTNFGWILIGNEMISGTTKRFCGPGAGAMTITIGYTLPPQDLDGDGVPLFGGDGIPGTADDDCDDTNAGVFPGAVEIGCDGIDNDCNPATEAPTLIALATEPSIPCFGGTTEVDVFALGGAAPYTGTGVYVASAGTHTYIVTDANGCTAQTTITLFNPPPVTVSLEGCSTVYSGMGWEFACATITANVTGTAYNHTYDWSTNESSRSITVCPDSTSDYTVTVTDANGCVASATWTVAVVDLACNLSGSQAPSGVSKISSGPKCSISVPKSGSGSGSCSVPSDESSKCSGVSGSAFKSSKAKKGSVLMCFEGETYCVKKSKVAQKMLCGFTLGPCDAQQDAACAVTIGPDTTPAVCPCTGRLTKLVVRYIGQSHVDLTANAKDCGVNIASLPGAMTGNLFFINASDAGLAYLRNTTYLSVDGSPNGQIAIPTNCCDNPVGRTFFPFLVVATEDETGEVCVVGEGALGDVNASIGQSSKDTEINTDKATITQYPNPASTDATFEFTIPTTEEVNVSIVNVRGELIANIYTGEAQADREYTITYDVSKLESGIYFVHMNTSNGVIKKKFVILR